MIQISKVIHTILSLTDNISKNIAPAITSVRKMQNETQNVKEELKKHEQAQKNAVVALEKAKEATDSVIKSVLKNSSAYQTAVNSIKSLEERNVKISASISEHQSSLVGLQQAYSDNQTALKSAQVLLENLKKEHGNNSESVRTQEIEVKKLKATYNDSLTAYREAKKRISQLKAEQKQNTNAIKTQRPALEKLKNEIIKNSSAVKNAESNIKKYENRIEQAKQAAKDAKSKISSLSSSLKKNKKAFEEAKTSAKEWGKSVIGSIDGAVMQVAKWGSGAVTAAGGFAIKTGLETSFNLEAYRSQLETATKDTQKAGKLMKMAVDFSNATPFTSEETIQATTAMEAYGVSSEKWLRRVADMAGATNKELEQATGAVIDVLTKGEYQSIEEFGIDKEQIMKKANQMFGKNRVFKKSGEIRKGREKDVQAVLDALMSEKFDGGAEKLSKTVKGLWSTITGVTADSLAKIFGMENGIIKSGSALDILKQRLQEIANLLTKWQQDGTLEYIANQFTVVMHQAIESVTSFFEYLKENWGTIKLVLKLATGFYIVAKAVIFLSSTMTALQIIMTLLSAHPIVLAIIAIVGAVWGLIKVIQLVIHWVGVCWKKFMGFVESLPNWAQTLLSICVPIISVIKLFKTLSDVVGKVWKKIKNFFGSDEEKNIDVVENIENSDSLSDKQLKEMEKNPKEYLKKITAPPTTIPIANKNSTKLKTFGKNTSSSPNITIKIEGDVYGYEEFKERVMGAFAEVVKYDVQNVT
ncbi:MAG: hypothetical protein SOR81_01100 [Fusobacterium sp.]|uniref:hypothetical protein n=1 Tax=Fusobacterium sp. TaxID=68766 RepID=UPI002A74D1F7|nr:hypothetical protein [Fusobacterium sp.]MDY2980196.1 hypothetical protein [Fusobacterium sp.]